MKIYFGKVAEELVDPVISDWFEHDGISYEYEVEMDEDLFHIRDVCGRYLPFDYSNVKELISALVILDNYTKPLQTLQASLDKVLSDEIRST